MNWQYLKYFEVVAEEQHFTRAAQKLFITPSALSRAISSLEEELHVALFTKTGRNVTLTKYGATFLEYVKQGTRTIDEGCKILEKMTQEAYGDIRISAIPTYASSILPRILKLYLEKHPNVTATILQNTSMNVVSDVLNGNVEFGFASDYIDWTLYPSLGHTPVMLEEIVLIAPESHPLGSRSTVTLEEIADEKFISFDHTSAFLPHIKNLFSQAGLQYHVGMMLSYDYSIAEMVRNGMGIALIPRGHNCISMEGLKVIHLAGNLFHRNVYMMWQKEAFSTFALDNFREHVIAFSSLSQSNT